MGGIGCHPWKSRTTSLRSLLFLLLGGWIAKANEQDVELTASSQFNMVLGPVPARLDLHDLRVVENATATVLLSLVSGDPNEYLSMETVIQESDFLASQQPSSKIRFFVLATTVNRAEALRVELNQLIEVSLFGTSLGRETFLKELRESNRTALANVSSVKVAPLVPASSPPTSSGGGGSSSRRQFSKLEFILVPVSGLILTGICYMIFLYHRDRGFFENERIMAANRLTTNGSRSHDDDVSALRSIHIGASKSGDGILGARSHDTPSTPSTIHSNEQTSPADKRVSPRRQQLKQTPSATNRELLGTTTPAGSSVAYVAADGESIRSITSSLDDSHWFASASTSLTAKRDNKTRRNLPVGTDDDDDDDSDNAMIGEARDTLSLSSDDGSEDVFFVDVESASNSIIAGSNSNRSHASSTAIAEWMKSIRVVRTPSPLIVGGSGGGSDTKTLELTPSSHGATTLSSSATSGPASQSGHGGGNDDDDNNTNNTMALANFVDSMAMDTFQAAQPQQEDFEAPEKQQQDSQFHEPIVEHSSSTLLPGHAPSTPPSKPSTPSKAQLQRVARVEV
ncbi:hypothetical protein ACA910_013542 [Epithemia clementina (nom. ined.)]